MGSKMVTKLKKFVTISKYINYITMAQVANGVTFRLKIYPSVMWRFLKRFYGRLALLFGATLLNLVPAVKKWNEYSPHVEKVFGNAITLWYVLPSFFRLIFFYLFLFVALLLTVRVFLSKERLFKIATKRLNDKIPYKKRAIKNNREASLLIQQLTSGRMNPKAYEFLTDLWQQYINNTAGLSVLTFPGLSKPPPVVCVDIDHLGLNPKFSKDPLNSLLEVHTKSRFPNFSKGRHESQVYTDLENLQRFSFG